MGKCSPDWLNTLEREREREKRERERERGKDRQRRAFQMEVEVVVCQRENRGREGEMPARRAVCWKVITRRMLPVGGKIDCESVCLTKACSLKVHVSECILEFEEGRSACLRVRRRVGHILH